MPMQATLLHSALPFMLNLPPTRVADKLRELLGEAQARPVLDKLMKATGSSEMIAQRVCLEVGIVEIVRHCQAWIGWLSVSMSHLDSVVTDFVRRNPVSEGLKSGPSIW